MLNKLQSCKEKLFFFRKPQIIDHNNILLKTKIFSNAVIFGFVCLDFWIIEIIENKKLICQINQNQITNI